MKNLDVLHLLLPGIDRKDRPDFHDFMGRCEARAEDRYVLELRADWPAALVRFDIEFKPGAFPYETLYCELTEHPSGRYVKTGPWDLALDPPLRMQIPTLDVHWRGEHYGNLWFDMPSPADIRERRLGGTFSLLFDRPGPETVRIVVPENERSRLDLTLIERIEVRLDNRAIPRVTPAAGWDPRQPWLFLGEARAADLARMKEGAYRDPWTALERAVDQYFTTGSMPIRGMPDLSNAAFMALVDPDTPALPRLVALLEDRRRSDAFLDSRGKVTPIDPSEMRHRPELRWLLGYGRNDYGFSWILIEHACVYQWIGDRLPVRLREWLRDELIRYGRDLYRFILFQRQYLGGQGGTNLHNHAPDLAVAALGAVLLREHSEAQAWLDFAFGRLQETLRVLPNDGMGATTSLYWGPLWLYLMIDLMRAVTGDDHRGHPFFRNMPMALWRHHEFMPREGFADLGLFYRRLIAACCAVPLNSGEGKWYYRKVCAEDRARGPEPLPACYLNVLWHTEDPGTPPAEAERNRSFFFPDNSHAILQTRYEKPDFAATLCGGPVGKTTAYTLESFAASLNSSPGLYGGFEIWVQGEPVLRQISSYRASFQNGNFVTVDGDGFFMDGAYLIGRSDLSVAACTRRAELQERFACFDILNTRAYRPDLRMVMARRQFFFDTDGKWLAVVDDVVSELDHAYALVLHAAEIETDAPGRFRCFAVSPGPPAGGKANAENRATPLYLQGLADQPATWDVVTGSVVLPYTNNVTQVKGGNKLVAGPMRGYDAPVDRRIVGAVRHRSKRARFVTIAGIHEMNCILQGEELTIRTSVGERRLQFGQD